jgi:hypothetical protein
MVALLWCFAARAHRLWPDLWPLGWPGVGLLEARRRCGLWLTGGWVLGCAGVHLPTALGYVDEAGGVEALGSRLGLHTGEDIGCKRRGTREHAQGLVIRRTDKHPLHVRSGCEHPVFRVKDPEACGLQLTCTARVELAGEVPVIPEIAFDEAREDDLEGVFVVVQAIEDHVIGGAPLLALVGEAFDLIPGLGEACEVQFRDGLGRLGTGWLCCGRRADQSCGDEADEPQSGRRSRKEHGDSMRHDGIRGEPRGGMACRRAQGECFDERIFILERIWLCSRVWRSSLT